MPKNYGVIACAGNVQVVPSKGGAPKRSNKSVNSQTSMSRTACNDNNYKVSNRFTETHKSVDCVTGSGIVRHKQEARATSTVKVTNKVQGITTEYKTQVSVKKVVKVVYPTTAKSSSNKRINYHKR